MTEGAGSAADEQSVFCGPPHRRKLYRIGNVENKFLSRLLKRNQSKFVIKSASFLVFSTFIEIDKMQLFYNNTI